MHVKPPVLATSRSRGWLTLWHRWRRHTGQVKQAMHGMEGVRFCTRLKAVTARWPPRGARRRRIRGADNATKLLPARENLTLLSELLLIGLFLLDESRSYFRNGCC